MLNAHYRSPLNFSAELMESSKNALERIRNACSESEVLTEEHAQADDHDVRQSSSWQQAFQNIEKKFEEAMDDDFNTADAHCSDL